MGTIAIVGSTGTVGSRVVRRLHARGHRVRAIARDPGDHAEGVERFAADLTDPDSAVAALDGTSSVYLTPPLGGEDPLGLESAVTLNVLEAAEKHAVDHVVVHTAIQADRGRTGSHLLDHKHAIEQHLAEIGIPHTVLRPGWFLQNLFGALEFLEQGMLALPWPGDMPWAGVDARDVAAAAVAFLEGEPEDRGFDLQIPGGITGHGLAAAASRALGREVVYHDAAIAPREYVDAFPVTEPHKDMLAGLFAHIRDEPYLGDPYPITDRIDGFEYHTVDDFMRDELFAAA